MNESTYRLTSARLERVQAGERPVDVTGDLRSFLGVMGLPCGPFQAATFTAESDQIAFLRVAIDSAPRAAREKREDLARAFAAALDAAGVKADTLAAYL